MPRSIARTTTPRLAALALAAACAGGAEPELAPERATGVPLPAGATYAWAATTLAPAGGASGGSVHARVVRAVDSVLVAHGYRVVTDPSHAQLIVDYHVGLQQQVRPTTTAAAAPAAAQARDTLARCASHDCWGKWGWWGSYGPPESTVRPYDYPEGSLMVDLVHRASGELAWRGIGTRRMDLERPQSGGVRAYVDDAMERLPRAG